MTSNQKLHCWLANCNLTHLSDIKVTAHLKPLGLQSPQLKQANSLAIKCSRNHYVPAETLMMSMATMNLLMNGPCIYSVEL